MELTEKDVVRIGDQMWMNHELSMKADPSKGRYRSGRTTFFTWEAAVKAAESVGDGWRLPTVSDWKKLTEFCGGTSVAGRKVKSVSGWEPNTGTDEVGFCGRPLGYYSPGGKMVIYQGVTVGYWSSDFDDYVDEYGRKVHEPIYWALEAHHYGVGPGSIDGRVGHCVRLVKDCGSIDGMLRDKMDGFVKYLELEGKYKVDVKMDELVGRCDTLLKVYVRSEVLSGVPILIGKYGVSHYPSYDRYCVSFLVGKDSCVIPFGADEGLDGIMKKVSECFSGFVAYCDRVRYSRILEAHYDGCLTEMK